MSIAEVQRHFTAYESGEIPEFELRNCLRNAIAQEPELCSAFVALIEAHRRANLIDPNLQSTLNADIEEVTGPRVTPSISAFSVDCRFGSMRFARRCASVSATNAEQSSGSCAMALRRQLRSSNSGISPDSYAVKCRCTSAMLIVRPCVECCCSAPLQPPAARKLNLPRRAWQGLSNQRRRLYPSPVGSRIDARVTRRGSAAHTFFTAPHMKKPVPLFRLSLSQRHTPDGAAPRARPEHVTRWQPA